MWWLSLEKAVYRILQLYNCLQSCFKSEAESQVRFKCLATAFEKLITEVYLLFYQSDLPSFAKVNLLLQREDPNLSCGRFHLSLSQNNFSANL